MNALDTLIRVHKLELDTKRRALSELEALAMDLDARRSTLQQELVRECAYCLPGAGSGKNLSDQPLIPHDPYVRSMRAHRSRVEDALSRVQEQMNATREEITTSFQNVKLYELARGARELKAKQQRCHLERQSMDEVAVTAYMRHNQRR